MRIATWNVNSVRARLDRLLAWLAGAQPDVVCLQEIKAPDADFPAEALTAAGYRGVVHGQRTYNGVAILARAEIADARRGLGELLPDDQARLLAGRIGDIHVVNAYVPNGQEVGCEAFEYKLRWMRALRRWLDERYTPGQNVLLCGDFNVAMDDLDVANPARWADSVLCASPVRQALEVIRDWGFVDVFRKHNPDGGVFSWWDYRELAFARDDGLRLDHLLASPPLAKRCYSALVHRDQRKGDKPSDHAPVVAEFAE